jgi:uncharacterized protein (DUF1501 family)
MNRRKFIQYSSVGTLASVKIGNLSLTPNHHAKLAAENDNILVIVQLFGGNDGLNTIIPIEMDSYYSKYRKNLQISKQDALRISNTDLAMHPSLKQGVNEGLFGLQKNGKLAIIQGVGYENPSFSHFRSSDIWLSGILPKNESEVIETGWIGRYFDKYDEKNLPSSPYSINISNSPSLIFQGKDASSAILLDNPDLFFEQGKGVNLDAINQDGTSYFGDEYNFIQDISGKSNYFSKIIKTAFDKGKNVENYANKSLSSQLKLVTRLISGGLQTKVYFVGISGFDTHSGQGTTGGNHALLLAQVSEAISTFMSDLEKQKLSKKVVGITISEFGRRIEENASFGTDHGTAGVMFAFGDEVKGQVFGKNLLNLALTDDKKNLVYQYDYRKVYSELLITWFGTSKTDVRLNLEKNFKLIEDGILKSTVKTDDLPEDIYSLLSDGETHSFEVFPNPMRNEGFLKANLAFPAFVVIEQYDISGKYLGELVQHGFSTAGLHEIPINLNGDAGLYILKIQVNNQSYSKRVMKF